LIHRILAAGAVLVVAAFSAVAQETSSNPTQEQESNRAFWIIPNYRTSPNLLNYEPLTAGQKFKIATDDSFDRGTVVLAGFVAGESQLTNDNKSFGQGGAGYGRYFGTAFGGFVIGDYMTEAVFPTILHQDPRYFRRGMGSKWGRLAYAVGQTFWTHNDSGKTQFNYSEIVGNSVAAGISMSYYSDNRTARDAASMLGLQVGLDAAANVLKEFWPDLQRKFGRKHQ
jgi:hypothetical protein